MSDPLKEAEAFLIDLPAAVDQRKLGQQLLDATDKLALLDRQIERLESLFSVANQIGFGKNESDSNDLEEVVDSGKRTAKLLISAETPDDLRKAMDEYQNEFRSSIGILHRAVQNYWRAYTRETFGPLAGIGQLLTTMNVGNNLGERMKRLAERAQNGGNASDAQDFARVVKDLHEELSKLRAEQDLMISEGDVGEFITALSEKRATLSTVTPKLRDWLKQNGALDNFQITPC